MRECSSDERPKEDEGPGFCGLVVICLWWGDKQEAFIRTGGCSGRPAMYHFRWGSDGTEDEDESEVLIMLCQAARSLAHAVLSTFN
jgi:hypothetical protein